MPPALACPAEMTIVLGALQEHISPVQAKQIPRATLVR